MNMPKLLILFSLLVFGAIGVTSYFKGKSGGKDALIDWGEEETVSISLDLSEPEPSLVAVEESTTSPQLSVNTSTQTNQAQVPEADRISLLFNRTEPKLPIVETIKYSSRVDWNAGKSAWLVDYSRHYKTSRHFIARSLNGRPDYLNQNIKNGDRMNILKPGKDLSFHLVVDSSRLRLWFYYHDADDDSRVLLKSYPVGIGRIDETSLSGLLTPTGSFSLGTRTATFRPKEMGYYQGERVEMVRIFGTRWIPFEDEVHGCTAPATGLGIHGVPWEYSEADGSYRELVETLGHYSSDGCIRMKTEDVEELFSIIITRPTTIHIAKDFFDVELPGVEKEINL